MNTALDLFPPRQSVADARLADFIPRAGLAYAQARNFDQGPGRHAAVSTLSPYLRLRMLDEVRVGRAVLDAHAPQEADKFLTEVFWRTYWKGWLELRPAVWDHYQRDLTGLHNDVQTQSGLRNRWEEACLGQTGIAPFDIWAQELVQTGYLHNHARMWFASIWIFTLGLPWQLGADFFLRHLLDGDVAANTLGWRWVAGIQTKGKTYLATQQNIATFTKGRFASVPGLAQTAVPRDAPDTPPAGALPACRAAQITGRWGVLTHTDDLDPAPLSAHADGPAAQAFADATADHSPWHIADHVGSFRQKAGLAALGSVGAPTLLRAPHDIADWAITQRLDHIVTPYAPVGPTAALLQNARALIPQVTFSQIRRPLDTHAWPLATKGFFAFRKHIPDLIGRFLRT